MSVVVVLLASVNGGGGGGGLTTPTHTTQLKCGVEGGAMVCVRGQTRAVSK